MNGIKGLRMSYLYGGDAKDMPPIPPKEVFTSNSYKKMFEKYVIPELSVSQIREVLKNNQFGDENHLCL